MPSRISLWEIRVECLLDCVYFGFARQQPFHLELLRATAVQTYFPDGPLGQQWWLHRNSWHPHVFEIDVTVSREAAFMASLDASDIMLYTGVEHLSGGKFGGSDPPLPLDCFLASPPYALVSNVNQTKAASTASTAKPSSYFDDLPWAEKLLQRKRPFRASGPEGPDSDSDSGSPQASAEFLNPPADEALLWSHIEELKAEMDDPKVRWEDFQVKVLGGAWTIEHKGVGADAIQGHARGQEAIAFCNSLKVPQSARYETRTYGEEAAGIFARNWTSNTQAFMNIWLDAKQSLTAFSQEHYSPWTEPSEFARQAITLAENSQGRKRAGPCMPKLVHQDDFFFSMRSFL